MKGDYKILWYSLILIVMCLVMGYISGVSVVLSFKGHSSDEENIKIVEVYHVTATVYHALESQCDGDPLTTASGAKIDNATTAYNHRYLAVSRDLLNTFPYGTKVEVSGCGELDGVWIVEDTMNRRYKGYIDLLVNPDMKIGKWEGVTIKKTII